MLSFGASMLSWIPKWTSEGGTYAIGQAALHGFDLIEISLPPSLDIDIKKLKLDLSEAGIDIRFTIILPPELHLPYYPAKALDHLKKALDIVEEVGGKFLGGVLYTGIGVFTGQPCTDQERTSVIDVLKEAAIYAEAKNIRLAVEPINRYETYVLNSAAQVLDLLQEIAAPNLGLMLDTFHMNIEEVSFYLPVVQAAKNLHYIHMTGSDRGMPGEDNVHWDDLFRGLKETGFQGDLVLENFSSQVEGLRGPTSLWRTSKYGADALAIGSLRFLKEKAREFGLNAIA